MSFLRSFFLKDPMLLKNPLAPEPTGINEAVWNRRWTKRKSNYNKNPATETPEVREAFRLLEHLVRNQSVEGFDVHEAVCATAAAISRIGTGKHAYLAEELLNFVKKIAQRKLVVHPGDAKAMNEYIDGCVLVNKAERALAPMEAKATANMVVLDKEFTRQSNKLAKSEAAFDKAFAGMVPNNDEYYMGAVQGIRKGRRGRKGRKTRKIRS
jgi:hypothetical protein